MVVHPETGEAVPGDARLVILPGSKSTRGDLAFLRDALMAPVEGDGEAGFRYQSGESDRFELPGLWLSSEELHALLASQHLLARTGGGVLSSVLAPLQQRAIDYEDSPDLVRSILAEGAERARDEARETLAEVRMAMGLNYR